MGIDIGGTFTDVVLVDEETGEVRTYKEHTTSADLVQGAIRGVKGLLGREGAAPESIDLVAHGTTLASNAVLEASGCKTGLLTTKGFRDILEMARGARPPEYIYDVRRARPDPLVPRRHRIGIAERLDFKGRVLTPLAEREVLDALAFFKREGVESIAVCFLFSYLNPQHERRVKELIAREYPQAHVTLSSDIHPEFREYERTCVTVLNAYVSPLTESYLARLEQGLKEMGIKSSLHIMQSNGGLTTATIARTRPIATFFSGPAAGVVTGKQVGEQLGIENLITADMGGTSFEVCMIVGAKPQATMEKQIGPYPVNIPGLDIYTIGAGGGSIAWVDPGGSLRVGPHSAGAYPGPACYGKGGDNPTTTDANLILGRIEAGSFLGGRVEIYADKAHSAIAQRIANPLGMAVEEAAQGIITILNAKMAGAIHALTVKQGYDARDFALVAFGGAGPLHALELAREMGIAWTVIPRDPGTASAQGITLPDIIHDYVRTSISELSKLVTAQVEGIFSELEERGKRELEAAGIGWDDMLLIRSADLRYITQNFTLNIAIPDGEFNTSAVDLLKERFHQRHEAIYGLTFENELMELVNLRLTAVGRLKPMRFPKITPSAEGINQVQKGERKVFFSDSAGWVKSPIYVYNRLQPGAVIEGPAILEQENSTIAVPPGYVGKIDHYHNLIIGEKEWPG